MRLIHGLSIASICIATALVGCKKDDDMMDNKTMDSGKMSSSASMSKNEMMMKSDSMMDQG